jgi:uncharacterized integral membrane protein
MGINEYLDAAKTALNTSVDAELARRLHISRSALCQIRTTGNMSEDTADRLALILKIEPAAILLDARASKSHNKRFIASVRRLLQQAGIVGTVAALSLDHAARCILCQMRRPVLFTVKH